MRLLCAAPACSRTVRAQDGEGPWFCRLHCSVAHLDGVQPDATHIADPLDEALPVCDACARSLRGQGWVVQPMLITEGEG